MKGWSGALILVMVLLVVLGVVVTGYVLWEKEEVVVEVEPQELDLLDGMSVEEKVGQVMSVAVVGTESASLVRETHAGMVGLFEVEDMDAGEVGELVTELKRAAIGGVRLWVFVDQEGGPVQRLNEGFSEIPSLEELCDEYETDGVFQWGRRVGRELVNVGVDGVWGPVVDRTNKESRVLSGRTCSENASVIVERVGVLIGGLKEAGVMTVVKHYPGLGATEVDPHDGFGQVEEIDWEVYESLLDEVDGVMVTHVGLGNEELPCTVSRMCVGPLVAKRGEREFLVMADAMEMAGVSEKLSDVEAAYLVLLSGVDVLVYGKDADAARQLEVYRELVRLYGEDELLAKRVDESVRRIMEVKVNGGK